MKINRALACFVAGLTMLAAAGTASAQLLFYDDFSQFPNGTVLTETNYVPGPWMPPGTMAAIFTNTPGYGTMIATNILSSTRLFFNALPNHVDPQGNADYGANLYLWCTNLNATVTNQVVDAKWLSWILSGTGSSSHTGGLSVAVATTNLENSCDSGSFSNLHANVLVFYDDNGSVYAFTNDPNNGVGPLPVVQIGSWGAHANTIMTNHLVLNYPARRFSLSLNGIVITNNMTIPQYFTNIFNGLDFGAVETLPTSHGNQFALDDVQIVVTNAGTDVHSFIVAGKGQWFSQTSASTPSLMTPGWVFHSEVQAVTTDSVWFAKLHFPDGNKTNLVQDSYDPSFWAFDNAFTSQSALDTHYSNGVYRLSTLGANQGFNESSLSLASGSYPNTPQIANFAAGQLIYATTNFTLQWNSSGGGTGDWVMLEVDDELGNLVLSTPDMAETNALHGTVTSLVITGGTLQASSTYTGQLVFARPVAVDTNSIPGAAGATVYFKKTDFPLATLAPGAFVDVSIGKSANTGTLTAGDTVTFTVTAHNNGATNAAGVTVIDNLPAGLLFGGASSSGTWSNSGNSVTMYAGDLAPGNTATLTISATALATGLVCNAATLTTSDYNTNSTKTANACITVNSTTADVYVHKAQDPTAVVGSGSNLTYTITVENAGPETATSVHLQDAVPAIGGSVLSNSTTLGTITNSGNLVTVDIPVLTNGQSGTVKIWVTAHTPALQAIQLTNTVTVSSQALDSNLANNTDSVIATVNAPPSADLAVSKVSSVATASLNNAFTYTLTVTNNGPNDAVAAQLRDPLPSGVTFGYVNSTAGTCTNVGSVVTCSLGTLASGTVATVSITVTASAPGNVCNTATVTNSLADPVTANNSANLCTPVVIHDMAVTAFKAPKKVALSAKKPTVVGKLSVTIQNRALHSEVITNLTELNNLVTVTLIPIVTTSCTAPVAQLVTPKAFPITLASGKNLKLAYTVNFICANNPLATTKTANNDDYEYFATVNHAVLDGQPDSHTADDVCPHNALGVDPYNTKIKDKGCGLKVKGATTGTFTNVVTDVIDTRR